MKYLVLEDTRKEDAIRELLDKKKIDAVICVSSNDFLTAMNAPGKFDAAIINAESWARGRAMYDYFDIGPKLDMKRVIFYNVDENITMVIKDRKPCGDDVSLCKPSDIEAALGAL